MLRALRLSKGRDAEFAEKSQNEFLFKDKILRTLSRPLSMIWRRDSPAVIKAKIGCGARLCGKKVVLVFDF